MHKVKVTGKGQTTIPAKIREHLGIKGGDALMGEANDHSVDFKKIPCIEDYAYTGLPTIL